MNVLSALAYILVCLWLLFVNEGETGYTVCPSKLIYHIPCPGCGTTRATLLFLKGNIIEAISLNPNCVLAVLFVTLYPIIAIFSVVCQTSYIDDAYRVINKILAHKKVLSLVLFLEIVVWIHNVIENI